MRVWELRDEEGRTYAIEISALASRRRVTHLVGEVPGVDIVRSPKLFSWFREEVFCEFDLDGERYEVSEPFGDNSRYLIGRPRAEWHPGFHRVIAVFRGSGLWFGPARFEDIAA